LARHAELSEPKTDEEILAVLEEAFGVALPLLTKDDGWTKYESKIPHVSEFVFDDPHHTHTVGPYKGGSLPLIKARGPVASIKTLEEAGTLLLFGEKEDWEADEGDKAFFLFFNSNC
jgi:hypothetical protein